MVVFKSSRIIQNLWGYNVLTSNIDVNIILHKSHNGFHFQAVFLRLASKELKIKWTWWMQVMEIYVKGLVLDCSILCYEETTNFGSSRQFSLGDLKTFGQTPSWNNGWIREKINFVHDKILQSKNHIYIYFLFKRFLISIS